MTAVKQECSGMASYMANPHMGGKIKSANHTLIWQAGEQVGEFQISGKDMPICCLKCTLVS